MKITKSQLIRIIKEELKVGIKESDDWYDDEKGYETVADRKWADQQAQRSYRTGVPDEEALEHGLDLEKYPLTPEELESDRIAQELEDAWVAAGNSKKRLAFVDDDILDMAMAVRDGDMTMEDALAQVNNLVSEGKAGKYGKGKGVPKDATKAEKEEQKRRDRHKAKQDLKKDELDEVKGSGLSQTDNTIYEVIYVIDSILERYEDNISTEDHKRMNDAANKLNRLATDLAKQAAEPKRFESIIQEMIDEVVDEELNEKCKGSGCATPEEVAEYGKEIAKYADNKDDINPYAVAWSVAKKKGSQRGTEIAGRIPGYKKGK